MTEKKLITPKKVENSKNNDSYYAKNKAKIKIQQKIYYQENKKRLISYGNDYYAKNKDKILERNKKSEKKSSYDKDYYLKNRDRIRQRKRYLYQQNKIKNKNKQRVIS